MAVKNNPVIAYVACRECGERASLHMVSRGHARRGMLYTRGCACKCNQSTEPGIQQYWREHAEPVEGYRDMVPDGFEGVFDAGYEPPIGVAPEVETAETEKPDNPSPDAGCEVEGEEENGGNWVLYTLGAMAFGGLAWLGLRG